MSIHSHLLATDSNPFATRYTRPGAIAFRFPEDETTETIYDELRTHHWCGQIVGPHGSGKTTLLRALDGHWRGWDRHPVRINLKERRRRLPISVRQLTHWTSRDQIIVDGYERLGLVARMQLACFRRLTKSGLLITSHRDVGFPTVLRTSTDAKLATQLVRGLAGNAVAECDVVAAFYRADGNMRELFFSLYDLLGKNNARRVH